MYVKDHMTKDPVTVMAGTTVSKALDLMNTGKFHRIPVIDAEGKLIGLITEGLISDSSRATTTSLSIYELNYLLSRTRVSDIMVTDVVTIAPNVFLEEAAQIMADHRVGVLPVVDEERHVLGILTDKDVFEALSKIMGYHQPGTRFVIACKDEPGEFMKICKLFAEENANLENLAVYHSEERGVEVIIKASGSVPVETMMKILQDAGFELRNVVQTEKSGKRIVWVGA